DIAAKRSRRIGRIVVVHENPQGSAKKHRNYNLGRQVLKETFFHFQKLIPAVRFKSSVRRRLSHLAKQLLLSLLFSGKSLPPSDAGFPLPSGLWCVHLVNQIIIGNHQRRHSLHNRNGTRHYTRIVSAPALHLHPIALSLTEIVRAHV